MSIPVLLLIPNFFDLVGREVISIAPLPSLSSIIPSLVLTSYSHPAQKECSLSVWMSCRSTIFRITPSSHG